MHSTKCSSIFIDLIIRVSLIISFFNFASLTLFQFSTLPLWLYFTFQLCLLVLISSLPLFNFCLFHYVTFIHSKFPNEFYNCFQFLLLSALRGLFFCNSRYNLRIKRNFFRNSFTMIVYIYIIYYIYIFEWLKNQEQFFIENDFSKSSDSWVNKVCSFCKEGIH